MSKLCLAAVAAAILVAAPAAAQESQSRADRAATDTDFMTKAAQGGMAEVELGNLAQQKATSQAVKDYGARMVADHGKANDELKQIAQKKNVTLPDSLGPEHEKARDKLNALTGEQFDRMYMRHMIQDHKKDLAAFRREAKTGSDPDVKAFAAKHVPILEEHLKLALQTLERRKK